MIGLVDLGIGNLFSLFNLFTQLGTKKVIIIDKSDLLFKKMNEISHLIIPGVGSYPAAMQSINNFNWKETIINYKETKKPILGICLGMQLFFDTSEENNTITKGLGILKGNVVKINVNKKYKLPHIGWNNLKMIKNDSILKNLNLDIDFYFLHSYKCVPLNSDVVVCETNYGEMFPSIVRHENVIGFQFHPEKSSSIGQKLIENFLNIESY